MGLTPPPAGSDAHLTDLVRLVRHGDPTAKDQLLHHACDRLLRLTRKMFRSRPDLARWMQTDDVFQGSLIRLHRALAAVEVTSLQHFFNLAAVQIRRELIDLSRNHFGPHGIAANHHTDHQSPDEQGGSLHDAVNEPDDLAEWSEFHQRVEKLPEDEREVVDLLFYQGMSQEEAADYLQLSLRTVRRRWANARFFLYEGLTHGPAAERDTQ